MLHCFCSARSISELLFMYCELGNFGSLRCVKQIFYNVSYKYSQWLKEIKTRLIVAKEYENFLPALLFFMSMKVDKSAPGKNYYFLIPNNKGIQLGAQHAPTSRN